MPHHRWWVSNRIWTGAFDVKNGVIVRAPPIAKRFIGSHFQTLLRWSESLGGHEMAELSVVREGEGAKPLETVKAVR